MPETPIQHPVLRRLFDYWRSLRVDGRLPPFARFDPTTVPEIMGRAMVIAVERDPLRFRYRIYATRSAMLSYIDLTGRYVDELPGDAERAIVLGRLTRGVADGKPTVIVRTSRAPHDFVTFESVMLLFADDGETVDTVVFGMHRLSEQPAWSTDASAPVVLSEHTLDD